MNANVKLVLMAVAAAVVANKVLAPPFAGLAPVQQKPIMAYGGTVIALGGIGALAWKKQPKAAALALGAAAGLATAGYQAGAYSAPVGNLQPAQGAPIGGSKALPTPGAANKIGVLAPGGGFGNAGPNGAVVFDKNPVPIDAGGGGGGLLGALAGGDDNSFPGQVNPGFGGMDNAPDNGGEQAGFAVRNQAGRASSLYG